MFSTENIIYVILSLKKYYQKDNTERKFHSGWVMFIPDIKSNNSTGCREREGKRRTFPIVEIKLQHLTICIGLLNKGCLFITCFCKCSLVYNQYCRPCYNIDKIVLIVSVWYNTQFYNIQYQLILLRDHFSGCLKTGLFSTIIYILEIKLDSLQINRIIASNQELKGVSSDLGA